VREKAARLVLELDDYLVDQWVERMVSRMVGKMVEWLAALKADPMAVKRARCLAG
jgi:hypothetical protein